MANGQSLKDMTSKFDKLEKFEGQDFRIWQKNMHFLLTTIKVVHVLGTLMVVVEEEGNLEQIRRKSKWENDHYICLGLILDSMCNTLFDLYPNNETPKKLWDILEAKYMPEDSSTKKFLVSNFNNYRMVEFRSIVEQYHELCRILGQFSQHSMNMDESISVLSIIDKLPSSWKDFKHNLKNMKG
ncbi:uncharacterized protein LOC143583971 [Bidens hawaiensis]|uniref:uncharacterized protein LOC143583971 n=1 Tax=Bidens hawaiensis TaxID=980011 RepID=UPI00404B5BBD